MRYLSHSRLLFILNYDTISSPLIHWLNHLNSHSQSINDAVESTDAWHDQTIFNLRYI